MIIPRRESLRLSSSGIVAAFLATYRRRQGGAAQLGLTSDRTEILPELPN